MTCEFSSHFLGSFPTYSPSSRYIASVSGSRVLVRNTVALASTNIYQCVDKIDKIEFSPDSAYILCALFSRGAIQVFSLDDNEWNCRINEGVTGIRHSTAAVSWTKDSRHIVSESDFGIQISIWSLLDSVSIIIPLPKVPYTEEGVVSSQVYCFSDCGLLIAVVHRVESQDQIGIYSIRGSSSSKSGIVTKFSAKSKDIATIQWTNNDQLIVTADSPLAYRFCVYLPTGELVVSYEAYQYALGIRMMSFMHPIQASNRGGYITATCHMVALGSHDSIIRLLSTTSWDLVIALPLVHPCEMDKGFDCHDMLLTVETVPASVSDGINGLSLMNANDDAPTSSKNGKQLPSHLQQMENIVVATKVHHSKHQNHHVERTLKKDRVHSYYELKSLKSLPRREQQQLIDHSRKLKDTSSSSSPLSSSSASPQVKKKVVKKVSVGVSWMGWSPDGQMIAARDEKYPRCLWIYQPLEARLLALLVQLEPITCAEWRPLPVVVDSGTFTVDDSPAVPTTDSVSASGVTSSAQKSTSFPVLAFCSGNSRVYFWSPIAGATWAMCPTNTANYMESRDEALSSLTKAKTTLSISSLHWSNDGQYLMLQGREAHCVCKINFSSLYSKATQQAT